MPDDLGELFGGAVVPEATPSPRTIRFATPPRRVGPSRAFEADTAAADPRVAAVFDATDEVTNVLVGPSFVAVTIRHPDRWEAVLAPLLRAVADGFDAGPSDATSPGALGVAAEAGPDATTEVDAHAPRRLARAWTELGGDDVGAERIVAAASDADPVRRQVAAARLAELAPEVARREWARLVEDPSRAVRRSAVDAAGDAASGALGEVAREDLRSLLEGALGDTDPWIRWRALRAVAQLGVGPSRLAVEGLASDPDFRVRLEAARVVPRRS